MDKQSIIITVGNEKLTAILEDNMTTRDFIEKLPLTLTMHDLYNREKYVQLNGLSVNQTNTAHFSKGDISYWTPGNAFVIYYRGNQEPLNGLVKMGEVLTGVELLENAPGDIEVTIDLYENKEEEK